MLNLRTLRHAALGVSFAAAVVFISGCDEIDKMNEDAAKRPVVAPNNIVLDAPGNQTDRKPKPTENVSQPMASNPTPPANDPNSAPLQNNTTSEKATAGVGKQGQGYGGDPITQPVHEFFNARDTITFDIQLKHQLDLWKAAHNNKPPKNKDEYMREIVEPCGVELPELPPGHRYVYDAKKGELMVESGGPAQ